MSFEYRPEHFNVDHPLVHGTFEPMRVEIVQVPCADQPDETPERPTIALTDPYATVIGTLLASRDTVAQAGAGIDGGYRQGRGAVHADWWAVIPDDGPPRLRFFAFIEGNSDGILVIDCDPVRDYLALNVLVRRRRLLIESHRNGVDGIPLHLRLLIDPVPTEGLRQVADHLLESADRQEELWWGTEGRRT